MRGLLKAMKHARVRDLGCTPGIALRDDSSPSSTAASTLKNQRDTQFDGLDVPSDMLSRKFGIAQDYVLSRRPPSYNQCDKGSSSALHFQGFPAQLTLDWVNLDTPSDAATWSVLVK